MRKTLTLFLLCLVWGKSKKPNVFLFIADDIGVTDISFASELYGEQQIRVETPHLDKIASKGQILSKFYVNNVGSTTRAALLTSTFSHKLGNPQITRHDLGSLEPNWRTFAHELVDRDYTTAHFGKWDVDVAGLICSKENETFEPYLSSKEESNYGPLARGFNYFQGSLSPGHHHINRTVTHCVDWHIADESGLKSYPDIPIDDESLSSVQLTTAAMEFVEMNDDGPLFMTISYPLAHEPLISIPETEESENCQKFTNSNRKKFCGMVKMLDIQFGIFMDHLKLMNMIDNSIIIFMSDNGAIPRVGGYNYPLRGRKGTPYEGGIHTPAFIYAPKFGLEPNTYDHYFHVVDMGPTILGMVDSFENFEDTKQLFQNIDGMDLSSNLLNRENGTYRTEFYADANILLSSITYVKDSMKMIINPGLEEFVYPESDHRHHGIHSNYTSWTFWIPQQVVWIAGFEESLTTWHMSYAVFTFFEFLQLEWYRHIDVKYFLYKVNGEIIEAHKRYKFKKINITTSTILLFDLQNDPFETTNLAENRTEIIANMVAHINQEIEEKFPPQSVAIYALLMRIFEEFKKIIVTLSIVCSFVFGGFCLTSFCLWYLIYYDPLTPEEQMKMRKRNKRKERERMIAVFGNLNKVKQTEN